MFKAEDLIQPRNRHILRFSLFAGNPVYKISVYLNIFLYQTFISLFKERKNNVKKVQFNWEPDRRKGEGIPEGCNKNQFTPSEQYHRGQLYQYYQENLLYISDQNILGE